jgi:hypothetical protein
MTPNTWRAILFELPLFASRILVGYLPFSRKLIGLNIKKIKKNHCEFKKNSTFSRTNQNPRKTK